MTILTENSLIDRSQIEKLLQSNFSFNGSYTIKDDGLIDIGSCRFTGAQDQLPVSFHEAFNFICGHRSLNTLKGSPEAVWGDFDCCDNNLTDLKDGPKMVDKSFYCWKNPLTSLEGLPQFVGLTLSLDWSAELPLLRLLALSCKIELLENDHVNEILRKHQVSGVNIRKRVLSCQKELIENGFEGNASW
jgi:hypothetical protein